MNTMEAAPAAEAKPATNGTETKPGNISVADLGKMLTESSRSRKQNPEAAGAAAAAKSEAGARETAPKKTATTAKESQTVSAPGSEEAKEGQEQAGSQEEPTAEAAEVLAEGTETGTETETQTGHEAGESTAEELPARAELPAELKAAIEEAKAAGDKGKASLLKRVHTVVDQRDTERMGRLQAEQQVQQLTAKVSELEKGGTAPAIAGNGDPVADHPAVRGIAAQIADIDTYLDWAEANPEGGELPDAKTGKGVFMDAAKVKNILRNGEKVRADLVAQRAVVENQVRTAHEEASRKFDAEAARLYPEFAKKDSALSQEAEQFARQLPSIKQFPDWKLVVGDYTRGRAARLAAEKAAAGARKPAAKQPARVVTESAEVAPLEEADPKKAGSKEQKQFEKTGRTTDLAKAFAARRRGLPAR